MSKIKCETCNIYKMHDIIKKWGDPIAVKWYKSINYNKGDTKKLTC